MSGVAYTANTYKMFNCYFSAATYRSYRLNVPNAGMTASLYEFQPAVCVAAPHNIEFSPASYSTRTTTRPRSSPPSESSRLAPSNPRCPAE